MAPGDGSHDGAHSVVVRGGAGINGRECFLKRFWSSETAFRKRWRIRQPFENGVGGKPVLSKGETLTQGRHWEWGAVMTD
jgi:hypothetical protein